MLRQLLFRLRTPHYYKQARRDIPCDCPLCNCPSSGKGKYSFVYICEPRRLVYFDIPKCASTSIRMALFQSDNSLSLINPKQKMSHYFKFTFVRNPWDRMVSNWKMFTTVPFRIVQLKAMINANMLAFEDFVFFAKRAHNHHWQPQVHFLPEKLDFVGRVETFEKDFGELCSKARIGLKTVDKKNAITGLPYWEYYTPSLVEVVREMYSEDIKRFGYRFGEDSFDQKPPQ